MLYKSALSLSSSPTEIFITIRNSCGPFNVPCQVPVKFCAYKAPLENAASATINSINFFIAEILDSLANDFTTRRLELTAVCFLLERRTRSAGSCTVLYHGSHCEVVDAEVRMLGEIFRQTSILTVGGSARE